MLSLARQVPLVCKLTCNALESHMNVMSVRDAAVDVLAENMVVNVAV